MSKTHPMKGYMVETRYLAGGLIKLVIDRRPETVRDARLRFKERYGVWPEDPRSILELQQLPHFKERRER